ncbi:MAG: pilus assembly protein PilZ [Hyphomicrobiales bacterium]|nr:pilus assembly protein PilZ [Hyphomicrobiales bacterium]
MASMGALRIGRLPRFHGNADEKRRHSRVDVSLLGRYMLSDRREYPCQTRNMSPGGLALYAPTQGQIGERVLVYLDQLGRIEGLITRKMDNGFALSFSVPAAKREKLADQLTWLVNRTALGMPEDRRHERVSVANQRAIVRLTTGREYSSRIIDISLSGIAIEEREQLPIGTRVTVGQTPGRVVRHLTGGFAIEFLAPVTRSEPDGRINF